MQDADMYHIRLVADIDLPPDLPSRLDYIKECHFVRIIPVSYTHLDVYKRQTWKSAADMAEDSNSAGISKVTAEGQYEEKGKIYYYYALSLIHI